LFWSTAKFIDLFTVFLSVLNYNLKKFLYPFSPANWLAATVLFFLLVVHREGHLSCKISHQQSIPRDTCGRLT